MTGQITKIPKRVRQSDKFKKSSIEQTFFSFATLDQMLFGFYNFNSSRVSNVTAWAIIHDILWNCTFSNALEFKTFSTMYDTLFYIVLFFNNLRILIKIL